MSIDNAVVFAWQAAEVLYFVAFYGELMMASAKPVFPETVFDLAALFRLVMVVLFAGYVVRDILRPARDLFRDRRQRRIPSVSC